MIAIDKIDQSNFIKKLQNELKDKYLMISSTSFSAFVFV